MQVDISFKINNFWKGQNKMKMYEVSYFLPHFAKVKLVDVVRANSKSVWIDCLHWGTVRKARIRDGHAFFDAMYEAQEFIDTEIKSHIEKSKAIIDNHENNIKRARALNLERIES